MLNYSQQTMGVDTSSGHCDLKTEKRRSCVQHQGTSSGVLLNDWYHNITILTVSFSKVPAAVFIPDVKTSASINYIFTNIGIKYSVCCVPYTAHT